MDTAAHDREPAVRGLRFRVGHVECSASGVMWTPGIVVPLLQATEYVVVPAACNSRDRFSSNGG